MSNSTGAQFHTWKPEPLTRGTFSILSSCLTTMFLCVWTAIHLNVPEYKKESQQFWRKVKWLVIALFAPEVVALCAYWQRRVANKLELEVRTAFNQSDTPSWQSRCLSAPKRIFEHSIDLLYFAPLNKVFRMVRSCAVDEEDEEITSIVAMAKLQDDDYDGSTNPRQQQRHPWTPTHSMYAAMGGFAIDTRGVDHNFLPGHRRRLILTPDGISFLLKLKPSLVPDISEATIKDKSKSSGLVKGFVCLQAAWFCAQCFSRWKQHLAVSLLELNTLAHALCALLIYMLWWSKPLDIEEPTLIRGQESHGISGYICMRSFYKYRHHARSIEQRLNMARDLPLSPRKGLNSDGSLDLLIGECTDDGEFQNIGSSRLLFQPIDVKCLRLAGEFARAHPNSLEVDARIPIDLRLVQDRITNTSDRNIRHDLSENSVMLSISLASLFYAGIHLIAWQHQFRTITEALLWKISGIVIGLGGPLVALMVIASANTFVSFLEVALAIAVYGLLIVYAASRVYIIIESFMDISHLPDSAFQVAPWSQYFWHAG